MAEEARLLHRSLKELPHEVASASGCYITLANGHKILDACGGAAVVTIGHCDPRVIDAMIDQARKVAYVHTMSYCTPAAENLAKCILSPREEDKYFDHGLTKAYFVCSGSEANDSAMKMARQYWYEQKKWQKKWFVARKQAYHGNTFGAMSVSSILARKKPYDDIMLPNVSFVGAADAYHRRLEGETEEVFVKRLVDEIEAEFLRLGPENIISFIGETVSGAALGSMAAPTGYWPAVRKLCDKHNILLHLDEVMCGMGRTGTYFAFAKERIQPDIVTLGKGLGGGYAPIAGMLINDKIVNVLKEGTSIFVHGHTYQAHPISCATALAVQNIVLEDRLVKRCATQGEKLGKMLRDKFENCRYVGDIRGGGLFWTLEFVQDKASKQPFPEGTLLGFAVADTAFNKGLAVYPGAATADGLEGDHVLVAPPYTITDKEMNSAVDMLKEACDEEVSKRGAKL